MGHVHSQVPRVPMLYGGPYSGFMHPMPCWVLVVLLVAGCEAKTEQGIRACPGEDGASGEDGGSGQDGGGGADTGGV